MHFSNGAEVSLSGSSQPVASAQCSGAAGGRGSFPTAFHWGVSSRVMLIPAEQREALEG